MKLNNPKEQSLVQIAFNVLLEKLGPAKTLDFWRSFSVSKIDYLKIKKQLFKGKSLNQIYKEAKKFNKK